MTKHRLAKRKQSWGNKLKIAGAIVLGATALAGTAVAQDVLDVKSSIRARTTTETTHNVNHGGLTFNTYSKTGKEEGDNQTATSINYSIALGDSNSTTSTSVWGRQTTDQNQVAADLTVGDNFFQPLWLVWDKETGDFQGADFMAAGKVPFGNVDLQGATYLVAREGEKPVQATYVTADNGTVGIGVGNGYDNHRRLSIGGSNKDVGALCDVEFPKNADGNRGDWSGVLMLSQNPGGLLSANGPKLCGDVFVIQELSELATFLSGIADKGHYGASLRLDAENTGGKSAGSVEAGYNLGNGLALSLGRSFGEAISPDTYGKASVRKGDCFVEARVSGDKGLETFIGYKTGIQ
jgi:hypothetical protein